MTRKGATAANGLPKRVREASFRIMWSICRYVAVIAASFAVLSAPANAEKVCVEEAAGVCLKYREVAPVKQTPSDSVTTRARVKPAAPVTEEQRAERGLNLSRNEYRLVQLGLQKAGLYAGSLDGVMGGGSREALSAWQAANGAPATGYLTFEQALALQEARPLAPRAENPPAVAPIASPAAAAPELPKNGETYSETVDILVGNSWGKATVIVSRLNDESAKVSVRFRAAGWRMNDECVFPVSGEHSCRIFQSEKPTTLAGALPKLSLGDQGMRFW